MSDGSFWNFSVDLYSKPKVESACLKLQNIFGLDVNNVLFCIWHGYSRGIFSHSTLEKLVGFSIPWRTNVINPVRSTRTWMKSNSYLFKYSEEKFETDRNKIKELELGAERLQQEHFQSMVSDIPEVEVEDPSRAMIENLKRYLVIIDMKPTDELFEYYGQIISALLD